MNSDGCRVKPPISTQRVAPLASWPRNGSAIITRDGDDVDEEGRAPHAARATASRRRAGSPRRRRRRSHWRTAKWNGIADVQPRGRRRAGAEATAARPARSAPAVAPSSQWSMVHHQTPSARAVGAGEGVSAGLRLGHRGSARALGGWRGEQAWTAARKASPRSSKSANWSNEAQAGESSTMASSPAARASAKAARDGGVDRRRSGRRAPCRSSVAANVVRGLADQIGLGHARRRGRPGSSMPPAFGRPPAIQ